MRTGGDWPVEARCVPPRAWRSSHRDLDHADRAVGLRRRSDRPAAEEPALGDGRLGRDVRLADHEVLADGVVDGRLERPHAVVVGAREIEVDAGRAVVADLSPRDEGPVEGLEGQRVDEVEVRVELAHLPPERRVHHALDRSLDQDGLREHVPENILLGLEALDPDLPPVPAEDAPIGGLPAATRVEGRAAERDRPGSRVQHGGLELVELGRLVAQESARRHQCFFFCCSSSRSRRFRRWSSRLRRSSS
jgi:hypothetical protein